MIIAIDPGLTGGIAVLSDHGAYLAAHPMPVKFATASKREIDAVALTEILLKHKAEHPHELLTVVVERQHAFPQMGVCSAFSKGETVGCIRGICAGLNLSLQRIDAASWKKFFHLKGGGKHKEQSRGLAIDIFPQAPLQRKKDEGVAEALLIGRWWVTR
jgi:crossover junction endodeoxyribonuclease RuvC